MDVEQLSRRLSYHLRHRPQSIGIELDPAGWVAVDELLAALSADGRPVTRADLHAVRTRTDKQRFEVVEGRIRARYGHSVQVDLGLEARPPPATLFHGTVHRFLDSILDTGLRPSGRQHVHLSEDVSTARDVGSRRGTPVVLAVAAGSLHDAGRRFLAASDGVWLTGHVPATHLTVVGEPGPD